MPFKDALLIAVKDGTVELVAELVSAESDGAEAFAEALRARIAEHAELIMTDPAILDPFAVPIASCVISRDPIPKPLEAQMTALGFSPDAQAGASPGAARARGESSIFARFQKNKRTQLDRWRAHYLRAADVSPRLARFEEALFDAMPDEPLAAIAEEGADETVRAAASAFGLSLAMGAEGIETLERAVLEARAAAKGRLVLHPAAVRGIAAFTGESIRRHAPETEWSGDDEQPLHVRARGGMIVRTDPILRAARFVGEGRRALLSDYATAIVRQSLTGAGQA